MTFIIELTSLIKTSSQTVILMNIIYIALKTSFKKQPFFELTSLLKMDLTFIIRFAQKLTSLIKMDLTSLFKMSFKKQPSDRRSPATPSRRSPPEWNIRRHLGHNSIETSFGSSFGLKNHLSFGLRFLTLRKRSKMSSLDIYQN